MDRRRFFGRVGSAAAFFSGVFSFGLESHPASASPAAGFSDDLGVARDRLLDALPSRAHAAEIGRVHLATLGGLPDAHALVKDVTGCLGMSEGLVGQCSPGRLRDVMKLRTTADFAAGRTVRVGGWVLGATEARLFTLAALV